jgi:hypothetical protein
MSPYAFITASIPHFYEGLQVTKPGGFTLPVLASPERSLPKRRIGTEWYFSIGPELWINKNHACQSIALYWIKQLTQGH